MFGNDDADEDSYSNRTMLFELCTEFSSLLANTWFEPGSDGVVTYRNFGVSAAAEAIRHQDFAQLDFIIVPSNAFEYVRDVFVDRTAGLRSQHFLLIGVFEVSIEKMEKKKRVCLDITALQNPQVCEEFRDKAYDKLEGQALTGDSIVTALHAAAHAVLPVQKAVQKKPWISQSTLELIDARNILRIEGKHTEEVELQKQIRKLARHDKRNYLDIFCWVR